MAGEMKHSELPWKASASGRIFAPDHSSNDGRASIVLVGVIGAFDDPELGEFNAVRWKADQELIVTAVNVHDEMVAALREALASVSYAYRGTDSGAADEALYAKTMTAINVVLAKLSA